MERVKEAIVVEGRDDTRALKIAFDCYTIETHGFHISKSTWDRLEDAYKKRGLIILTDPDYAGENIRKKIKEKFPEASDCYISRDKACDSRGKFGVEYAQKEDIREAILKSKGTLLEDSNPFSWDIMMKYGLVFGEASKKRRIVLGNALGIGYGNAKTFFNKLNSYGISKEEFEKEVLNIEESL